MKNKIANYSARRRLIKFQLLKRDSEILPVKVPDIVESKTDADRR